MNQWEFMDKEYIWHPFTQMKGWNENKQLVIMKLSARKCMKHTMA